MADPWGNAQAQVAVKYDPQMNNLQRQVDSLKAATEASKVGIQAFGDTGRTNTNAVYDTLNQLLSGNRTTSAGELSQTQQQIGANYDAGMQYQNAISNASRDRISALAREMGGGAAGELAATAPLEQTANQISGWQNSSKMNAMSNMANYASKWDQILGQGVNMGEQSRTQSLSEFENQLLKAMGETEVTGLEGQNQLFGKMADLMGVKSSDLIATYQQLVQQEWENSFKQAQLDQEASIAQAQLDQAAAEGAANRSESAASRAAAGQMTEKDWLMYAADQRDRQDKQDELQYTHGQNSLANSREDRQLSNSERAYNDAKRAELYSGGNSAINKMLEGFASNGDISSTERNQLDAYAEQLASAGMMSDLGARNRLAVQNALRGQPTGNYGTPSGSNYSAGAGSSGGIGNYGASANQFLKYALAPIPFVNSAQNIFRSFL